ncbi:hypothetical protein QQF64_001580 [Cirrhinus molitorella]|uniref:Secreted protein n=1 Tax=Cirrhinus molitorella TaxID=172907 RepID=A0ABR3P0Z8_9TELE
MDMQPLHMIKMRSDIILVLILTAVIVPLCTSQSENKCLRASFCRTGLPIPPSSLYESFRLAFTLPIRFSFTIFSAPPGSVPSQSAVMLVFSSSCV